VNQFIYTILFFSSNIGLHGQTPSLGDYPWLPVEAKGDVVGHTSGTTNILLPKKNTKNDSNEKFENDGKWFIRIKYSNDYICTATTTKHSNDCR
jgi:hypothetical protein